jgi:hypothetical protein
VTEPSEGSAEAERPVLRVVRGEPTAEELAVVAALVAALSGAATGEGEPAAAAPLRGRWNDPSAAHRRHWLAGPGAWRA